MNDHERASSEALPAPVGLIVGHPALGIHDTAKSSDYLRKLLKRTGDTLLLLDLSSSSRLDDLWQCRGVILLSDGAYPEAGNALTLACLHEWMSAGGVLGCIGASPFLLSSSERGQLPMARTAIDVLGFAIGNNAAERGLIATRLTPSSMTHLERLTDLNKGASRLLTLHAIPDPSESFLETDDGSAVFSSHRIGKGWLVNWAAAVQGAWAPVICDSVAEKVLDLTSREAVERPAYVIDPLQGGGEDGISALVIDGTIQSLQFELDGVALPSRLDPPMRFLSSLPSAEPQDLVIDGPAGRTSTTIFPAQVSPIATGEISPRPDDFDAFWASARTELAAIPDQLALGDILLEDERMSIQRFTFVGSSWLTISGLIAHPKHPHPGRPGIVSLPGYNAAGLESLPLGLVDRGAVAITVDVRGVGSPTRHYVKEGAGLLTHRLDDPRACGLRGAVLDSLRALDILAALPTVNEGKIAVTGGSQGGALAIMVAALDSRPQAVASSVPFLCNIAGSFEAVSTEPYAELQRYLADRPHLRQTALRTLSYFDAVHFAELVSQPSLVTFADNDDIAPSAGARLLANEITRCETREYGAGHISPALVPAAGHLESWIAAKLEL